MQYGLGEISSYFSYKDSIEQNYLISQVQHEKIKTCTWIRIYRTVSAFTEKVYIEKYEGKKRSNVYLDNIKKKICCWEYNRNMFDYSLHNSRARFCSWYDNTSMEG